MWNENTGFAIIKRHLGEDKYLACEVARGKDRWTEVGEDFVINNIFQKVPEMKYEPVKELAIVEFFRTCDGESHFQYTCTPKVGLVEDGIKISELKSIDDLMGKVIVQPLEGIVALSLLNENAMVFDNTDDAYDYAERTHGINTKPEIKKKWWQIWR